MAEVAPKNPTMVPHMTWSFMISAAAQLSISRDATPPSVSPIQLDPPPIAPQDQISTWQGALAAIKLRPGLRLRSISRGDATAILF